LDRKLASVAPRPVVFVVDDDEAVRALASSDLEDAGYVVETADDVEAALAVASRRPVDVILLDIALPRRAGQPVDRRAGIEAIADLRAACPAAEIVMLSAHDSSQAGMDAVRQGASAFVVKPYHPPEQLLSVVERALERRRMRHALCYLREEVSALKGTFVAGSSLAMRKVVEVIEAVAPTDATVLVTGETGTGKELAARAVHGRSLRKEGPFVAVNAAVLPQALVESTLFGHERGAFTGAVQSRAGLFETARGGSLFLDEIGELDSSVQAKLLRVLQEEEFERVGGTRTIRCDVRVIAATNRDLREEVRAGRFREDLYFRLAVIPLALPPLRDRLEDLSALAGLFLDRYASKYGKPVPHLDDAVLAALRRYDWPGNIRELEHLVQRLVVLKRPGEAIGQHDLPLEYRSGALLREDPKEEDLLLRDSLVASERDVILRTLERCGGNRHKAAGILGIHPATMFRKLQRLGINRTDPAPLRRRKPE
jgi:two-component system response regulator HydG